MAYWRADKTLVTDLKGFQGYGRNLFQGSHQKNKSAKVGTRFQKFEQWKENLIHYFVINLCDKDLTGTH